MRKFFPPLFPLLLLLSPSCHAQSFDDRMLPEGSKDIYVGLALQSSVGFGAAIGRPGALFPLLQAEWSNGVFLRGIGQVGWRLSESPGLSYGPLLQWQNGRSPTDAADLAGSREIRPGPRLGGFVDLFRGDELCLSGMALAADGGDLVVTISARKSLPQPAAHQRVSLSLALTGANGAHMRKIYGLERGYAPSGGLVNVYAGADWSWELNHSWVLGTELGLSRLGAPVADSPLVGRRSSLLFSVGLARRF